MLVLEEGKVDTLIVLLNVLVILCRAFGLWVDGELDSGLTNTCSAFNNPPLTGSQSQFSCAAIEVYDCSD